METRPVPLIPTKIDDYATPYLKSSSVIDAAGAASFELAKGLLQPNFYIEKVKSTADFLRAKIFTNKQEKAFNEGGYSQEIKNQTFYRRLFFEYVADLKKPNGPGGTPATMENLFDTEGITLFHLALEEEANSMAFIQAVLENSITEYPGIKWDKKLVELIGGASGSGKTTTAKWVTEAAKEFIQEPSITNPDPNHKNYTISVDGGIVRFTSHIRKLAILLSYHFNYIGISDLEDHASSLLDNVKDRIKNFSLHQDNPHGVVVPETFSKSIWPFTPPILSEMAKLKNNPFFVFCEIKGEYPETFQYVVNMMGEARPYDMNVKPNQTIDFDLNKMDTTHESKPYNPQWFLRGMAGTAYACEEFKKMFPDGLYMLVINDLVPHTNITKDANNESTAESIFISARALNDYVTNEAHQKNYPDLKDFIKATRDTYHPIIMTTASLAIKEIEKELTDYSQQLNKKQLWKTIEYGATAALYIKLQSLKDYLVNPKEAKEKINVIKEMIQNVKKETKDTKSDPKFLSLLVKLDKTVDQVSTEIKKIHQAKKQEAKANSVSDLSMFPSAPQSAPASAPVSQSAKQPANDTSIIKADNSPRVSKK